MGIVALHHFGLTVRDVRRSAAWYTEVLGFHEDGAYVAPGADRAKIFLRHEGFRLRLGLTERRSGSRDPFDETRVGLDHVAFAVTASDELAAWEQRLVDHGVVHSPIAPANSIPGASVLVLRDPDNIQLELFFDPAYA